MKNTLDDILWLEYLSNPKKLCSHSSIAVSFDPEAAKGLTSDEVRVRWPRGQGYCFDCGFSGIVYASYEHYIAGDW